MALCILRSFPCRRVFAVVGIAGSITLTACSATKQVTEQVRDDVEQVPVANQQACAIVHKTIVTAAEAAVALTGKIPASLDEMVALGLLRQPPTEFDYAPTPDGDYLLTPKPGGPCEGFTP